MHADLVYTPKEAIESIQARINGEFDNKQLEKLGPLNTTIEDIQHIIEHVR